MKVLRRFKEKIKDFFKQLLKAKLLLNILISLTPP